MQSGLILVGEPMGLLIAQTEGSLNNVSSYDLAVAGAEFNVAIGTARLEHKVTYMTKLGDDPFGKRITTVLKDNKIDLLSLQEHAIATLSCKASLKGNSHLSIESMQTIVDNLMRCDNPYVCPHGRPTIIHYSAYDLEKLFKRVV